jgi:hypothetical protein
MVSEIGVDADVLRDLEHEEAVETLRAAFIAGVTVVTWHVADSLDDLEPLIVEAVKSDRGRLTLVAILDYLPTPDDLGPQVEAVAARLGGTVDIVAFPEAPTDAHAAAIDEIRARHTVRFVAYSGDTQLSPAQTAAVDVIITTDAAQRLADLGAITLAEGREDGDCTAIPARSADAIRAAIAVAALT